VNFQLNKEQEKERLIKKTIFELIHHFCIPEILTLSTQCTHSHNISFMSRILVLCRSEVSNDFSPPEVTGALPTDFQPSLGSGSHRGSVKA